MKRQAEYKLLSRLQAAYFDIVPVEYQTFCTLTATVTESVMRHYGFGASVKTCQVWYKQNGTNHNFVIGFLGRKPTENKWDGHTICLTDHAIFDAAMFHFQREFEIQIPPISIVNRITVRSHLIASTKLSNGSRVSWLNPPPNANLSIPKVPSSLVKQLAVKLIAAL